MNGSFLFLFFIKNKMINFIHSDELRNEPTSTQLSMYHRNKCSGFLYTCVFLLITGTNRQNIFGMDFKPLMITNDYWKCYSFKYVWFHDDVFRKTFLIINYNFIRVRTFMCWFIIDVSIYSLWLGQAMMKILNPFGIVRWWW